MSVNCPDCQRLYNTHKAHDQVHKSKMIHAEQQIAALKAEIETWRAERSELWQKIETLGDENEQLQDHISEHLKGAK
jgi:predicted  nucleic acid-binding Zn-ribbon protein